MSSRVRFVGSFVAFTILSALVSFAAEKPIDLTAEAAKVLEADKAFCEAAKSGDAKRWSAFFDENGIMFSGPPGAVRGRAAIEKALATSFAAPGFKLLWWPIRAEVSTDGQLGYSYGQYDRKIDSPEGQPVSRGGTYITVWKKQKDGSWKVLSNFGTGAEMATERKSSS